jgi:hypothetical protein
MEVVISEVFKEFCSDHGMQFSTSDVAHPWRDGLAERSNQALKMISKRGSHIERFAKGILGLRDEPRRDGAQHSWREGSRENPISVPHAVGKRC